MLDGNLADLMDQAVDWLRKSRYTLLFTGAGISVESGIPPFRGPGGLWTKHNPDFIEINHFMESPKDSWAKIREIFYDKWGKAVPNPAHYALAELQNADKADLLVTQNIDCLHQHAGSPRVAELHGTLEYLVCMKCHDRFKAEKALIDMPIPACPHCGGLLKPDVVFFGEALPENAVNDAFNAAKMAEVVLVVGTTGEVMPAGMVPREAKMNGAKIIEVNLTYSALSDSNITNILLQGKAGTILPDLVKKVLA